MSLVSLLSFFHLYLRDSQAVHNIRYDVVDSHHEIRKAASRIDSPVLDK